MYQRFQQKQDQDWQSQKKKARGRKKYKNIILTSIKVVKIFLNVNKQI